MPETVKSCITFYDRPMAEWAEAVADILNHYRRNLSNEFSEEQKAELARDLNAAIIKSVLDSRSLGSAVGYRWFNGEAISQ